MEFNVDILYMADYGNFPGYTEDPRVWHILERCMRLQEVIRKKGGADYYAFGTLNSKKCLRRKEPPQRQIFPRRKKAGRRGSSASSIVSSVSSNL